jgi:hypothetical protein
MLFEPTGGYVRKNRVGREIPYATRQRQPSSAMTKKQPIYFDIKRKWSNRRDVIADSQAPLTAELEGVFGLAS